MPGTSAPIVWHAVLTGDARKMVGLGAWRRMDKIFIKFGPILESCLAKLALFSPCWPRFGLQVPPTWPSVASSWAPRLANLAPKRPQKVRVQEPFFDVFSQVAPKTAQDRFWTKFSLNLDRFGSHVWPSWLCFGSKNPTSTSKNRFGKTSKTL